MPDPAPVTTAIFVCWFMSMLHHALRNGSCEEFDDLASGFGFLVKASCRGDFFREAIAPRIRCGSDAALVRDERKLRQCGDAPCEIRGEIAELRARPAPLHDPKTQSFGAVDELRSENEPLRRADAGASRQALG